MTAAALSLAVNKSGAVATQTVVLLTPGGMDQAFQKELDYRTPGHSSSSGRRRAFERDGASCYGLRRKTAPVAQLDRVSVFETEG